jgi:cell division protein FtsL
VIAPELARGAAAPRRRTAEAPEPRHLRVVTPVRRRRRLNAVTAVLVGALVVAGMLAVAASQTMLVQGQLQIDQLEEQVSAEKTRYQQLRLRVAQLESPDHVVRVAIERLGMVPPDEVVYVTPDRPASSGSTTASGTDIAASDESWQDVKPYLETTP